MNHFDSKSSRSGRRLMASALLVLGVFAAEKASALDVFSLWRQPRLEVAIEVGAWVEYRTQKIEGGRQTHDHLRVQCVADHHKAWTIEILPLREIDGGSEVIPGEGWRFDLSHALLEREGDLVDHVSEIIRWQKGEATVISEEQWREDPLITTSLRSDSRAGEIEEQAATTRVVLGEDLLCRQFTITAVDTARVRLPRGELMQISSEEVSVALHADIPFLGVAYAAERSSTRSAFDPPGRGRRAPPPSSRVEIMELTAYGRNATAALGLR